MTVSDLATITAGLPPYARALGMTAIDVEGGAPLIEMPYSETVMGRPGFFHGGSLGGLMEIAGISALHMEIAARGGGLRFKPVNINVEFLRGAVDSRATLALGEVTRSGRRVANVSVRAWQEHRHKPVAVAWMNFLLLPEKE